MGVCIHPRCEKVQKGKFCGPHWHDLPADLQGRIKQCKSTEEKGSLLIEACTYFEGRMIGRHEIFTCRGRKPDYDGCGADIVWMKTRHNKNMPVNADTVSEDDVHYEHGKHTAHWATCPKAEQFRK